MGVLGKRRNVKLLALVLIVVLLVLGRYFGVGFGGDQGDGGGKHGEAPERSEGAEDGIPGPA